MLSVERYNLILELIKQKKNIKLNEIVEELKISEATARRDLNFLEEKKKIKRDIPSQSYPIPSYPPAYGRLYYLPVKSMSLESPKIRVRV